MTLGKSGKAWWRWAWSTPQAAAWATGHEPVVARRAQLEDDLATTGEVESLDLEEALDCEKLRDLKILIGRLTSLATGRLGILREMRELDDRLGLTPKSMAALRWTIVAESEQSDRPAEIRSITDRDRFRKIGA